jgi:hypothetical protein
MDPAAPNPPVPPGAVEYTPPALLDPADYPSLDDLITEDGKPVENIYVAKQYQLLTEPLYSSWAGPGEGRSFLALANVGWFYASTEPPLVTDFLLSLDATPAGSPRTTKEGRSYFQWLIGKPPEAVIEIVSDRHGGEEHYKPRQYARQGLMYYIIYDPTELLGHGVLRAFARRGGDFVPIEPQWLPEVGLGLSLWTGTYAGVTDSWLRWCDRNGQVIPTGAERAERLAAQLRALGAKPEV